MTCGIYLLSFHGTHKLYVGQSICIEKRYKQHCTELLNGTHTKKLQDAFHSYGLPTVEIQEECAADVLDDREQYYIKLWDSVHDGFNHALTPAGGTSCGELNSNSKYLDSEILSMIDYIIANPSESLVSVSKHTGICYMAVKKVANGETYRWLADVVPEKYEKLMSLKGTRSNSGERQGASKYSNSSILKAFYTLLSTPTLPNATIASMCNISESAVLSLCSGTNYKWIQEQYPEDYQKLKALLKEKRAYSRSAAARGIVYPPIVSPIDGSVHYVDNVNKFAKANGLDTGSLNKVLNGKAKSTKGWKLAEVTHLDQF